MSRTCLALLMTLALVGTSFAADLCVTSSVSNNRNISVQCSGTAVSNLYAGFGETVAEACTMDGCPNPGGDCGCGMAGPFQWWISRSATDPYDTVGPLATSQLYLWLTICSPNTDWTAAEFGLAGSLQLESFLAVNGFQDFGSGSDVMINHSSGCLSPGDYLVGTIQVQSAVPVPGGVDSGTWGHTKALYSN